MDVVGSCHCGQITYRASVDPEKASLCHCTDCQTLTGTAYRVSVPAPRESFQILSGVPRIYVKTAESGNQRAHAFCPNCGTPIYAAAVIDPPTYSLRVGGLQQRALLPPRRQMWCRSAVPWSEDIRGLPAAARQ